MSEREGIPLTVERLTPGDTPTGISTDIRRIPKNYYRVTDTTLVTNGTMEAGDPVTGWTDTAKATNASNASARTGSGGTKSIAITLDADGAGHGSYQDLTTVAGTYYRLRFYYKNGTSDFAQINVVNDRAGTPADIIADTDLDDSTSFSTAQDYFFAALGTSTTIYLNGKNNSDVVYFDDVSVCPTDIQSLTSATQVKEGSALYWGYRGRAAISALVIASTNTMRFTLNGEPPTNSTAAEPNRGIPLADGESIMLTGQQDIENFQVCDAVSGSAGYIDVICYF